MLGAWRHAHPSLRLPARAPPTATRSRDRPAHRSPAARGAKGDGSRLDLPRRGYVDSEAGRPDSARRGRVRERPRVRGPKGNRRGGARVHHNVPPGDGHQPSRRQMPTGEHEPQDATATTARAKRHSSAAHLRLARRFRRHRRSRHLKCPTLVLADASQHELHHHAEDSSPRSTGCSAALTEPRSSAGSGRKPRLRCRTRVTRAGFIGQPARRDLANQIRRIILDAHRPSRARWPAVIISHRLVLDVELDLSRLALRLLAEDPVDVRGVASVRALICDGSGPLYASGRTGANELRAAIEGASEALELDYR